jgi:hypothetical protein
MSAKPIWTIIKQKVENAQSLHGTYNYEEGKPDGYPYATVTLVQGEAKFGDSAGSGSGRNIEQHEFVVRVYQERETELFGAEKAERIAMEILDELLTAFHNDTTLSGQVKWQLPTAWQLGYDVIDKAVRTVELTIETTSVVNSK